MKDGLYQVTTRYLCAGFVVRAGRVVECAPILRKRLDYWKTIAVRTGRDPAHHKIIGWKKKVLAAQEYGNH